MSEPAAAPATTDVPSLIGEYKISRVLGGGPMGTVYYGTSGGRVYDAIKVLDPERAVKLDWANRCGGDLTHQNLVRWTAVRRDAHGRTYLVTDFIQGKPATVQAFQGAGLIATIRAFVEVADALTTLHRGGVAHGNVKPSNILVRKDGKRLQPILGDAGLDYVWAPGRFTVPEVRRILTHQAPERLGALVGGLAGAPAGKPGPAADIYGLSATLAEALTGRPLYPGAGAPADLLSAKRERKYLFVAVNHPAKRIDVPGLNRLLEQGLAFDPAERPDIVAFRKALAATDLTEKKEAK